MSILLCANGPVGGQYWQLLVAKYNDLNATKTNTKDEEQDYTVTVMVCLFVVNLISSVELSTAEAQTLFS